MKTNMLNRISILSLFIAFVLFISSCEKPKINTNIDVDGAMIEFMIDSTNQTTYETGSQPVTFDLNALASKYKFDIEDIKSIKVEQVTMYTEDTNSPPYTFDMIKSIEGYIKGANSSQALIIDEKAIPVSAFSALNVNVTDAELKDLIKSGNLELKFKGELRDTIKHAFKMKSLIKYKMNVDIKP